MNKEEFSTLFYKHLKTKWLGQRCIILDEVDSTNDLAYKMSQDNQPEGLLVLADYQRKGRGQKERKWYSPKGENLYFSFILNPAEIMGTISLSIGIAISDTINKYIKERAYLKWPNDVLVRNRKISGILLESKSLGRRLNQVIVGVGINLNTLKFPFKLRDTAISLAMIKGESISRPKFLADVLGNIERWYETLRNEGSEPISLAWKERTNILGKMVQVKEGAKRGLIGIAVDLDSQGALLIRAKDNTIYPLISGRIEMVSLDES
jgi:BirA family biotin operon repressor/biotin-[acetyl-CoA-carboxylase] ligase